MDKSIFDAGDHGPSSEEVQSSKTCSRRDFLKIVGVAGGAIGLGGGLAGMVAACGGTSTTASTAPEPVSTTAASVDSTAGTTATTAVPSTSASAGVEKGREIKVGFVTPTTGKLATFGAADTYCRERWLEFVKDGLVCGDKKNHPVTIITQDSQSDSNRAGQVAADLIMNNGIDLMVCASTPDTTLPVADQCEANGVPCVSNDSLWQGWFNGRGGDPKVGFKWTYHFWVGSEDFINLYFGLWDPMQTNKVYGSLWPNDADGTAYRKAWPGALKERGYGLVDTGPFEDGLEDYTKVITMLKSGGAEICAGSVTAPDFSNFWKQAKQQGYNPKACTVGKALMHVEAVEALGELGYGLTTVIYWKPTFPFKSSLTGETCQELADDFEKRAKRQWTQVLTHYAIFEVAVDALKRTADVDDKEQIIQAVSTANVHTIQGPVDFSAPVKEGSRRPVKNVYRVYAAAGQWVKGTKWPYDLRVTSNVGNEAIPTEGKTEPIS